MGSENHCCMRDDGKAAATVVEAEASPGRVQTVTMKALGPFCRALWKVEVEGLENIPATGPAIIAPNHISFCDSVFVPAVLPRRISYVGKAEYMDDWKTKYLFPAMGMIPLDRSGGEASTAALDTAARLLSQGELFGIYPEGTRSRSGKLHKGRTGVARLSMRTGAPIIPTGIIGTREVQPPDTPMMKPFKPVKIRFGRPIDPSRFRARDGDPLLYREITDEVMFEIAQLSGQTYVHEYASKPTAPADGTPGAVALETRRSSAELLAADR